MPNASFRRKIVLCLLLVTVLAVPWASAAGHAAPAPPDLFLQILSFFTSLWGDSGCNVDPSGRCVTGAPGVLKTDEGCNVDPSGRCGKGTTAPLVRPDEGCHIDPNGVCGAL